MDRGTISSCSWQAEDLSAITIDGESIRFVGGVWGSAPNNVYATASSAKAGAIIHYDGQAWAEEMLTESVLTTIRISGRADGSQVLASAIGQDAKIALVELNAGIWSLMANQPDANAIMDIVYAGNQAYAVGQDLTGANAVWRQAGDSWVKITLPNMSTPYQLYRGYGTTDGAILVGNKLNAAHEPVGGVMMYLNGATWSVATVPAACMNMGDVHGTSLDDVYVTCTTQALDSMIYHVTNASQWEPTPATGVHMPVWTFGTHSAVTVGFTPPSAPATNTLPEVSLFSMIVTGQNTQTVPFTSNGQLPIELWFNTSGYTGFLATFRGLYRGTCR